MFHDDGIEVYLKPAGDENDRVKLAEFPLPKSQVIEGDERNRRCAILAQHGKFRIIVRLSPEFKMYKASALLLEYHLDYRLHRPRNLRIQQRSKAYEQIEVDGFPLYEVDRPSNKVGQMAISMTKVEEAIRGTFDKYRTRPLDSIRIDHAPLGSIVVRVCRGNVAWIDTPSLGDSKANPLYGPGDPNEHRKRKEHSKRPSAGEQGKWYTFEFHYRSEGYIRARHDASIVSNRQASLQNLPIKEIALTEDEDFLVFREEDQLERQMMSEAFKRRQAALADGRDAESADNTLKQSASTASSKKSSGSSRLNQPRFCNCPDASHNRAYKTPRAIRGSGPRKARPRAPKSYISTNKEATCPGTSETEKDLQPDENDPTVCTKCSGLKVADSRRPAFLRKWYGENPQPRNEVADDDEELPPPPAEQSKGIDSEDVFEVEGEDKDSKEGEPKDTKTPASVSSGEPVLPEYAHEPAVAAEETTAATDSEELIANPSNDTVVETPDVDAPTATVAAVAIAADEIEAAVVEGGAADRSDAPTEGAVDDAQATPNEQPPAVGATTSRKRTSEPPADVRPAKQQRLDIDLTGDDEPVIVKSEEPREETKSVRTNGTLKNYDREELQARLLDIKMRREELQLRREEAEVARQLRELARKEHQESSRRSTEFIKIED